MSQADLKHDNPRTATAWLVAIVVIALGWAVMFVAPVSVAWAQAAPGTGGEAPAVPVTVVKLDPQDVTLTARMPGRIVAARVAEVRPQVNGLIVERLFNEGAHVSKGDPLYQIDSATYEAAVDLAEAQVAAAEARLTAARKAANRTSELVGRHVASQQTLDQAIAERDAAIAELGVAKARLHSAQIDLNRTTIRAPISGVVGRSLTTQGALVTAGQAIALATIRTLDPVLVDVTQSAAQIIEWRRKQNAGDLPAGDPMATLILPDGSAYPYEGRLTAAEPHVDEQTGVVTLRIEFPNPDHLLLPGMYAVVEMPQGVARDAILAPMEGVGRDRRGRPTALVANEENVVELRQLTVIGSRGSDWIVTEGMQAGDRLIVAGLQKIRPGVTVAPEPRAASAPDDSASDDSGSDDGAADDGAAKADPSASR